jgi:hypothetical protein
MAIRNSNPVRFTAKGLCDAYDATDAFAGACQILQNLVFDQGNPELMSSRPGVGAPVTTFSTIFVNPTFVSVYIVIGHIAYGMVSTGSPAGMDQPFSYDLVANVLSPISGASPTNLPASPPTTGPWTPPTMAVISTKIIVTHPGFSGVGANFFGVIDITNPAAPTWTSANTATNPLTAVPTSVANYNNRAYFAVGNFLEFSDVLVPTTRTNASQAITVGDTTPIIAQSGLPIQTTSAGVVGALIVFKASQIWQVTGDPTTSNLALNYITLTTGTIAPRSVVQVTFGICFVGVDAPYVLNFLGVLSPLSHQPGNDGVADVQLPFQNATTPSRIAAAFSGNIYRVCVATTLFGVPQTNDYWYDIRRKRWTGPHTFPYDCAAQYANQFVVSGIASGAALFISQGIPTTNSSYNDNGTQLVSHMRSSSFPKTNHMAEVQVVESTLELSSSGASVQYQLTAYDQRNVTVGNTQITTPATGFIWGSFVWGDGSVWSTTQQIPVVYTIPWKAPLVFQKMSLDVQATSSNSLSIGTFFARYQDTGYTNQG